MNRIPFASSRPVLFATLLATLLAVGACGTAPMEPRESMEPMKPMATRAMTLSLGAQLSGANEVPAVAGGASGSMQASLDPHARVLTWTISHAGLSGAVTGGHFHGPAAAGQNAGVALALSGNLASPISGTATLSAAQIDDLMAGRWYLNLHTAANHGGEIRGQVVVQP